jgi:hypothetical protein
MAEYSRASSVMAMLGQPMPMAQDAEDMGRRPRSVPGLSRSDDASDAGMSSNSGTSQFTSTRMHPRIPNTPGSSSRAVKQACETQRGKSPEALTGSTPVPRSSASASLCNRPVANESLQAALCERLHGIGRLCESLLDVANEGAPAKNADLKCDAMAHAPPAPSPIGIFAPSKRGPTSRDKWMLFNEKTDAAQSWN